MAHSKHMNPVYEKGLPRKAVWQSADMNERQFMFYYDWLVQLSCSRFQWQGLPDTIDRRFFELVINSQGLAVFFFENENYDQFFATQATPSGTINMYREPTRYQAYGAGAFNYQLQAATHATRAGEHNGICVPIWNNYTRTPTTFALELYARRLSNIDRAIDTNLAAQKMPIFVTCSEEQRLTVTETVKQWQGNEPVIIGDGMAMRGVELGYISSGVDYITDKLLKDKMTIWCEIMSFLGINNNNIVKGERVQAAEVQSNDSQIDKSALMALDTRRWACEDINRIYGLNVWVDLATDYSSLNWANIMVAPAERYGAIDGRI